jgi:hypothetical protein
VSNRSKLRASLRAAQLPDSDAAGAALADVLAGLLDAAADTADNLAGLETRLEIIKVAGPQYLRTLTALGLTRAGRGATAGGTVGSPQGVSADDASHDEHRRRFAERQAGNG